MRVGDYELCIVNGLEAPGTGQVRLRHGQVYQLALTNHGSRRSEVSVTIDGKEMGNWRCPAGKTIVLERPVSQDGQFTFFRLDSKEAKATKIPGGTETGLVCAWFVPEKQPLPPAPPASDDRRDFLAAAKPEDVGEDDPMFEEFDLDGDDRGGTGLTGKSVQQYGQALDAFDGDFGDCVTVELRLLCELTPIANLPCEQSLPTLSLEDLQISINILAAEIKVEREADDYLAPGHFDKMQRLIELKVELRLARFQKQQAEDVLRSAAHAEYEGVSAVLFACPDCGVKSRVPSGAGRIRIKCPKCTCQFVREA